MKKQKKEKVGEIIKKYFKTLFLTLLIIFFNKFGLVLFQKNIKFLGYLSSLLSGFAIYFLSWFFFNNFRRKNE
jgi:hypothetical protein